jgi:hypothetical protein
MQRKSDGQAGRSDALVDPIAETSLACADARGMLALKANVPRVNTVARYFFMIFSFD